MGLVLAKSVGADISCVDEEKKCRNNYYITTPNSQGVLLPDNFDAKEYTSTCNKIGGKSRICCNSALKNKQGKAKISLPDGKELEFDVYAKLNNEGKYITCPNDIKENNQCNGLSTIEQKIQCSYDKCIEAGYTKKLDAYEICMSLNIPTITECPQSCGSKGINKKYIYIGVGVVILFIIIIILYFLFRNKKVE